MMKTIKWAKLLELAYNGQKITCPECGGQVNSKLYARDENGEKRGFAILECNKCKKNIHFSRVKFPENVKTEIF